MSRPYDYNTAGFDAFLCRSIDEPQAATLEDQPTTPIRQMNFDQAPVSGSLGDILNIGKIDLDGGKGRMTIYDENGNEAVWVGDIDGG